jgi:hypothetical protein
MTIVSDIRAALETHLATTPALPRIAYPNVPFEQNALAAHIEVDFSPTSRTPANRGPNPQYRHQGLFVLTVCVPEDQGSGQAYDIADVLLGRFAGSSDVLGFALPVSINTSEVLGDFKRPPFFCVPVSVSWYAYEV